MSKRSGPKSKAPTARSPRQVQQRRARFPSPPSLKAKIRLGRRLEKEAKAKLRHLYDDQGHVDAKAIARELGWHLPTLARAVGLDAETLKNNTVSEKFQKAGHRLAHLLETLLYLFGEEQVMMAWLKCSHPDLRDSKYGKQSPLNLIRQGHLKVVEGLVDAFLTGQPG